MTDSVFRRRVVGVMGSGRLSTAEAEPLGQLLAGMGYHLLTGGGGGQMEAVARAFVEADPQSRSRGLSIGVLPGLPAERGATAPLGYPNRFVELPIRTHLGARGVPSEAASSRNSINVSSSRALVFLWGEQGTLNEADLAESYERPARLLLFRQTEEVQECRALTERFAGRICRTLSELESWLRGL